MTIQDFAAQMTEAFGYGILAWTLSIFSTLVISVVLLGINPLQLIPEIRRELERDNNSGFGLLFGFFGLLFGIVFGVAFSDGFSSQIVVTAQDYAFYFVGNLLALVSAIIVFWIFLAALRTREGSESTRTYFIKEVMVENNAALIGLMFSFIFPAVLPVVFQLI